MELRERLSIPHATAIGFNLRGLLRRGVIGLARRYPRSYLAMVTAAAGLGYSFILLFPYLLYSMSTALYDSAPAAQTVQDWLLCAAQAVSLALGAVFTYTLFKLRFTPPAGRELTEEEAPRLFKMLAELRRAYGKTRIHRVLLDDTLDVRVIRTPRSGLPLFTTRTLVIGLPVLQTVSPYHLRVLLARCIGQLAPRNRRLATWLYQLNDTWQQYAEHRNNASPPARLVGCFFSLYAPLYKAVSVGLAHRAELNADRCVLDVINHQEAADAISFHAASRDFLIRRYWPTIERMAARAGTRSDYLPFERLTEVTRKGLSVENLNETIARLYEAGEPLEEWPGVDERLENIGYSGPIPLQVPETTAATYFLEDALPGIVKSFDARWLKQRLPATG